MVVFLISCETDDKPVKEKDTPEQEADETSDETFMVGDFLFIKSLDSNIKVPKTYLEEDENYSETSFPGGTNAMQQYIIHNVRYPRKAIEKEIEGKVYVTFNVQVDGSITDVKAQRGVHPLLDKEAIRVIKSMPNWIPATDDGIEVVSIESIPITFTLR